MTQSNNRRADLFERLRDQLTTLYGSDTGAATFEALRTRLQRFPDQPPPAPSQRLAHLTAADAMLITYGDQVQQPGQTPLHTLHDWLGDHLGDTISSVHLLPFYPYSSDDGFSVIDYTVVDPALGDWSDIERLSARFKLMFDAVINHISAGSAWFQGFLQGDPQYADWFIVHDEPVDVSTVTRPRTHPLLTTFETATGPHRVWTTFSADQIDLNFKNPAVLIAIIDVLLLYAERGSDFLRLDAIGYLWKELGTRSIHLPQTHLAVQLIRTVLDIAKPDLLLITETNVPHADNISYFGDGYNEAQLVYQFPLAPLVLNAFQTGSARYLQGWAATLETPSPDTAFFNFIASHDGIGVQPAKGILSDAEIDALAAMAERHGGRVGYKTNSDGSQSAYELNITLMDALSDPATTPPDEAIDRFMAANAILLALQGLPGIYVHSLVGSQNDLEGMARTGHNRTINRRKWQRAEIDAEIAAGGRAAKVLDRYRHLLIRRARSAAFHPAGAQRILPGVDGLFVIERTAPDGSERVVCIHNVSRDPQRFALGDGLGTPFYDLVSDSAITPSDAGDIDVPPHAVLWLRL